MVQTISRIGTVSSMTGLPKSSIYRKVADGEFPKPIKLGERSSGWVTQEVQDWLDDRIKQSRSEKTAALGVSYANKKPRTSRGR